MIKAAAATLVLAGAPAWATPPDTSSMPQLILPPAATAEEEPAGPVLSYSMTAASNYLFRGVSQTEDGPALFAAARVSWQGFYAGVGAENVDFHNATGAEYDLSAGWTPKLAGFVFDVGVIRYGYENEPAHTHIDTVDYKGVALRDFGPATLAVAVFYTPGYFGSGHDGVYYEGRGSYRIFEALSVGGALGRQTVTDGIDHTTWNAGVNYAFIKNVALDLRYYDTDEHRLGSNYGSHYVAALKLAF